MKDMLSEWGETSTSPVQQTVLLDSPVQQAVQRPYFWGRANNAGRCSIAETPMPHPFIEHFRHLWPPDLWRDVRIVAAVSGGADSMAMLRAIAELQPTPLVHVAHFDHQLRDDSKDDAAFVDTQCRNLRFPCLIGRRNNTSAASEESARNDRYAFLTQTASDLGARFVVVAHTADDQAETVLHRVLRGSGVRGLAGIGRLRRLNELTTIVRPLLTSSRADVLDYLQSCGQPWRDDPTNATSDFTRNRIRNELLPELEAYNARIGDSLRRIAESAAQTQAALEFDLEGLTDQIVARSDPAEGGERVDLDVGRLRELSGAHCIALLQQVWRRLGWPEQAMDAEAWNRIRHAMWLDSVESRRGQNEMRPRNVLQLPGKIQLQTCGSWLRLLRE